MDNLSSELADSSALVRKALEQRFGIWATAIAGVLQEGQAKGQVSGKISGTASARFLIGAWEGTLTQMKVVKSPKPIDDFLKMAFIMLEPR